jgi:hypothetical protein
MGIYLGATELGGGGGSGGGAIPETAIFTASGSWIVPQSVQDEIASEGHAEIGLLMVGGGVTAGSGEIVSELYQLTTGDYNSVGGVVSSPPTVSVVIGGVGGHSGITTSAAPTTFTQTVASGSLGFRNTTVNYPLTGGSAAIGPNGFPLITTMTVPYSGHNGGSVTINNGSLAWSGSGTPTLTTNVITFSAPTEFDGSLTFAYTNGGGYTSYYDVSYNAALGAVAVAETGTTQLNSSSPAFTVTWQSGGFAVKQAREGGHANANQFSNNDTDEQGYFDGLARFNGARPNSGSGGTNPQAGYVQIFYT